MTSYYLVKVTLTYPVAIEAGLVAIEAGMATIEAGLVAIEAGLVAIETGMAIHLHPDRKPWQP